MLTNIILTVPKQLYQFPQFNIQLTLEHQFELPVSIYRQILVQLDVVQGSTVFLIHTHLGILDAEG